MVVLLSAKRIREIWNGSRISSLNVYSVRPGVGGEIHSNLQTQGRMPIPHDDVMNVVISVLRHPATLTNFLSGLKFSCPTLYIHRHKPHETNNKATPKQMLPSI